MRQGRTALTMAYQSLYLKYRPQTFDDVIGQDHVCQTLRLSLIHIFYRMGGNGGFTVVPGRVPEGCFLQAEAVERAASN